MTPMPLPPSARAPLRPQPLRPGPVRGAVARVRAAAAWAAAAVWQRAAYGLALLPVLTDWFDTGHWPEHPREFSTELVIGAVIFAGVHRLHRRAERYRADAETDALTHLHNRRRFHQDVALAVDAARSRGERLVLAYVDVDHFKAINDRHGHDAGDEALRAVGRALRDGVRQSQDSCYRLGGDEFAVLLSNVSEAQALEVLRRGFEQAPPGDRAVTCSVGVAALRPGDGARELVSRADAAMYRAKHGDRRAGHDTQTKLELRPAPASAPRVPSPARPLRQA